MVTQQWADRSVMGLDGALRLGRLVSDQLCHLTHDWADRSLTSSVTSPMTGPTSL
jgi:hypothetical protein